MPNEVVGVKLPVYISDSVGAPVTGLTFSGAEVLVGVDSAGLVNATGAIHEIGGTNNGRGAYYYDSVAGDRAGERLLLFVRKSGDSPYIYSISTRERAELQVGGDDAQWGIPVFLVNAATSLPLTGAAPGSGELLVSVDGGAWGNALGTWLQLDSTNAPGAYRYTPHASERATTGLWMILAVPTSASPYIYATYVGGGSPEVDAVTPTPNTAPGAAGGFSSSYATAKETPIVVDLVDDATLAYACVFQVLPGGARRAIYRKGSFEVGYKSYSTQELVTGHVRLHIRADDGWPPNSVEIDGDLVDTDGNVGVLA